MRRYLLRRWLLTIPTFFGITLVSFVIINLAPGSPLEQKINELRFAGEKGGGLPTSQVDSGISQELIQQLNEQYGFDKPIHERYLRWLKNIATGDFGESFVYQQPALDVIVSKFPVSLQFGIGALILTYLISIPLGVLKAIKKGTHFDGISGLLLYASYATPQLVLGIFLIIFFAGGSYLSWFPVGMLKSDDYDSFSTWGKVLDRAHHFVLPLICYVLGGFAEWTMLMRNSMLEVIQQDYIRTARAKGVSEKWVVLKHALRNALLPLVTSLGGALRVFLAGSLIVETVFQLDGIGLLSYRSIQARDYNVLMALIFLTSLTIMLGRLLSDLVYRWVDPRIDFK